MHNYLGTNITLGYVIMEAIRDFFIPAENVRGYEHFTEIDKTQCKYQISSKSTLLIVALIAPFYILYAVQHFIKAAIIAPFGLCHKGTRQRTCSLFRLASFELTLTFVLPILALVGMFKPSVLMIKKPLNKQHFPLRENPAPLIIAPIRNSPEETVAIHRKRSACLANISRLDDELFHCQDSAKRREIEAKLFNERGILNALPSPFHL